MRIKSETNTKYVIMQNHMHGIIKIGMNPFNQFEDTIIRGCRDAMHGVSTPGQSDNSKN